MEFYRVATIGGGFLAIMARPRAHERARGEFTRLADAGVRRIVSLLEVHEEFVLGLEQEAAFAREANIDLVTFPIPERGVPRNFQAFARLSHRLHADISGGSSTAIHCRAGLGRSSLLAAAVLLHAGIAADEAFERIRQARGRDVPDTPEQAAWLRANSRGIVEIGVPDPALH